MPNGDNRRAILLGNAIIKHVQGDLKLYNDKDFVYYDWQPDADTLLSRNLAPFRHNNSIAINENVIQFWAINYE